MDLSLFQLINYSLILILLILFIRYLWIIFMVPEHLPVQWQEAVKKRRISPRLRTLEKKYPDKTRFFSWWFQVERLKRENVAGVFVELGVYKGESAAIIHQMDTDRPFHLFDTFSGFVALDLNGETGEAATYTTDHFADTSIPLVLKKIKGNHNIILHQGYFPDCARDFQAQVALVNIDVDLYKPTKAGLEFFYPMLSPGGLIIVHDYNHKWPGVVVAVDDFIATIPENLVILPDRDGTVVIIRNK
jgi:O-methyltransferase